MSDLAWYNGNLDDFIRDYHLEFDVWVIKQNFDLGGVEKILIEVYW